MKITNVGIEMIKMFEGVRLASYKDSVGVWTIGYGHTSGVKEGQTIDMATAEALLRQDLYAVEAALNTELSDADESLEEWQYDALVSFTFNLGFGAISKSTLLGLVLKAEFRPASQEFGRWIYAGGKASTGLKRRRFAEAVRFLGGDFPMVSMAYHGVN